MSIWTGIKTFFSGGSETASKVLDAGIAGLDKMVLTDEERVDLQKELAGQWIELNRVLGDESTVRSVTRRIIAFMTVCPYVLLVLAAAVVWPYSGEYAGFLLNLADGKFGILVIAVGGFYFGPHMLSRMLK